MVFYFRKGKTVSQTVRKICAVYGEGAVSDDTVRRWFARFQAGLFSLKDLPQSGRPSVVNETLLNEIIRQNPRCTLEELASRLDVSKTAVYEHLKKTGYASRYDVWVPHSLTERNVRSETAHFWERPGEATGVWMGCFGASSILPRHCTF